MIAYASRTGTRRNLSALRAAGWRLLVSATGVHRTEGFQYAIDNGAWTAYQQQRPFDSEAFLRVLRLAPGADWVALPDVVMGGLRSLVWSISWITTVLNVAPRALLPVQDGMIPADVAGVVSKRIGIFIGGSDEWKEQSAAGWGALACRVGCWCHMGRVNSARRIALAAHAGCHSFDGTSASRFALSLGRLDRARNQGALFGAALPEDT